MSLKNRTWDGTEVTGSITGFKEYSTIASGANEETLVITPKDILERIKEIKQFVNLPELDDLNEVLYTHISSSGNPHNTRLSDYPDDIISAIYAKYVKFGGKLDKDTYTEALFKVLHVATVEEMKTGTDESALLSIANVRQFLHEHEIDPDAHKDLINAMLPGEPVTTRPVLGIHSRIGVPLAIQQKFHDDDILTDRTVYSYIGLDGYLHTCDDVDTLPVDYSYGEPLIPMFGTRTNEIITCNDLSKYATVSAKKGSSITSISGKVDSYSLVGTDTLTKEHTVTIPNIELSAKVTKTFSIYAKAGSCRYLMFSFTDLISKLPVRATFDLQTGEVVVLNHVTRYTGECIKLRDGWCRCIFSMYSDLDMKQDLVITYFKEKIVLEQDMQFAGVENEAYIHFYGAQLEEGAGASPLIVTTDHKLSRDGIYLQTELNSCIDKNITVNVTFRNNVQNLGVTDRPICNLITDTNTACTIQFRSNRMIEIDHWASLTSGTTHHDTLISQYVFDAQDSDYCKVTACIGESNIVDGCNTSTHSEATPEVYNVGSILIFGSDGKGTFYEGYVRDITVYPCEVTEQQALFLDGEETYEY